MKPSEYIRKGWCQRMAAMDSNGLPCAPTSRIACKWCVIGAIDAAYSGDNRRFTIITEKLYPIVGAAQGIGGWNDEPTRTQADAIALLESIGE